jgi:hypothetical protein
MNNVHTHHRAYDHDERESKRKKKDDASSKHTSASKEYFEGRVKGSKTASVTV